MSVASARIPVAEPLIGEREIAYVTDAVRSGWVSSAGRYVDRFESDLAAWIGVRHAIAVANGTVALHLALHAMGLGPGDEVVVPDLTFAATAHAVLLTGATPVLVDVEPDTFCLDPRAVERALSPRTRAIVPVHLYGHPADMTALRALAASRRLQLVEDAAEAHGAQIGGARVGGLGDVGAFSFYGNKILTTGEGGALTTDDDALAARMRLLKDHGMRKERRYFHEELAFNYRMTNLAAALGVAQLERASELLAKKRAIMGWYREGLSGLDLRLSAERPGVRSAFWLPCAVLGDGIRRSRDEIAARLSDEGIDTRPFFVPMSQLPHLSELRRVSRDGRDADGCPVAARLSARGLNLPGGCGLERADVDRVCAALGRALRD
jgi:perosamine synthetase